MLDKKVMRMLGYKIAIMVLALALLAPAASAMFEGVHGPGLYYGGVVGGERFEGVKGPVLRYDGYHGGHAYSFGLDRWVSIGGEVGAEPSFVEMVRARQNDFNLLWAVLSLGP